MHQSSNHSKFQRMRRRLDLFRQKKEEQSVSHPLRACLPFLCATGVLMTTVVTAASCTLCYRVDAQGQSLAFFHDVATYDAAVSQAETRASKILETQYSLNQDLSVRATLAPKDQIESLSGVTGSLMESIPELEHVYTLSVDGTMVGAAQDPSVITQALNLVKNTSILAMVAGMDLMYFTDSWGSERNFFAQAYFTSALLYFIICFPLARLARYLEIRSMRMPAPKKILFEEEGTC